MSEQYKAGDVVYLRSGSPPMTVTDFPGIVPRTVIQVEWFVGDDVRRDAFMADSLTAEKPAILRARTPNDYEPLHSHFED